MLAARKISTLPAKIPRAAEESLREGTHFELSIGPSRDLDNHVEDSLVLIGKQGDVVEERDGDAILLNVYSVLESVGSSHLADRVRRSHGGLGLCLGVLRLGAGGFGSRARQVSCYLNSS